MERKRKFNRQNSCRCIEYWTSRGYTEEQAKIQISQLQRRRPDVYQKAAAAKQTTEFKNAQSATMKKVYTLQYWIDKLGDVEGREKFNAISATLSENGKASGELRAKLSLPEKQKHSCRSVAFWLDRGLTEEDAKAEVAKRQSRGLKYYLSKYGEIDGRRRWKERQEKWQKSFQENNHIAAVNHKRRTNAHVGLYTPDNVATISDLGFYLIRFEHSAETFLKFGLTKHEGGYRSRWGRSKYGANITSLVEWRATGTQCFALEQELKTKFSHYAYQPQLFSTTEALRSDAESVILPFINEFIRREYGGHVD